MKQIGIVIDPWKTYGHFSKRKTSDQQVTSQMSQSRSEIDLRIIRSGSGLGLGLEVPSLKLEIKWTCEDLNYAFINVKRNSTRNKFLYCAKTA